MENLVKVRFSQTGHVNVYRLDDLTLFCSFSAVAGDVLSISVPEDCYIEFVPISLFV